MPHQPATPRPATPDRFGPPSSGTIQPLYVKPLPESNDLRSAVVSPDGNTIWALVDAPVVDVGRLINQHALTCASIIAAVLTLVLLAWLRRASRRRATVGALHCRRCDYTVSGIAPAAPGAAAICPECGVDLTRRPPRRGQTALRRLWLPATLMALVLLPYGWFTLSGRKVIPRPIPEQRWGSLTLQRWSSAPLMAWIKPALAPGEILLELDTQTGATRRVIAARPSSTFFQMDYNPAAKGVYLARGFEDVDLVSVENGSIIASLRGQTAGMSGTHAPLVAGHSGDAGVVFLACADANGKRSWVTEWDWRTGKTRELLSVGAWPGATFPSARHHVLIPGSPRRFLRYTDFGESFQSKHYRLSVVDASGVVLKERDLGEAVNPSAIPSFSSDGSLIFIGGQYGRDIQAFDSTTLEDVDTLEIGVASPCDVLPVRADGRLMLVPGGMRTINVRDMQSKTWGPALAFTTVAYGPRSMHFSADGRTICAVFQSGGNATAAPNAAPSPFVFLLGAWRLPEEFAVPESGASPTTHP